VDVRKLKGETTMTMPKSIETYYKGYRFRSLLEARWAVFFDAAGIKYVYEPEGFDLDGTWYLPDFFIPDQNQYLEIKPDGFNPDGHPMFRWLQSHDRPFRFAILIGQPFATHDSFGDYEIECRLHGKHSLSFTEKFDYDGDIGGDNHYRWCECPCCGKVGLQFDGRSARIGCGCEIHSYTGNGDKTYNSGSPKLLRAYLLARQYRPGDSVIKLEDL
jgi:hypothetical protein